MDTATRKKRRESNIELLRLVCMGMIVLFHCTSAIKRNECTEGERIILTAIGSWGILGVDTFIIITAWFMRKATEVKLHKTVGMIAMTLFYIAVLHHQLLVHLVVPGALRHHPLPEPYQPAGTGMLRAGGLPAARQLPVARHVH